MHAIDSFLEKTDAVIFDMDGLLIDSEPYWKIAEKKIFGELGLQLDDDLLRQVMGFRLSEVVRYWYNYQPWPNPDFEKTEADVLNCVMELIASHAEALPGIQSMLAYLHQQNVPMAVASSSAMRLIETVVHKLNIRHYFQLLWSAEYEPYGKPHPGIFIATAQKLGVQPTKCLVFEDSVNGVIAAKAARMLCIAVPEEAMFMDPRFALADYKIHSVVQLLQDTQN
jgi:mannitol-1-/sugar-/sorbitol-6-/2-deoxyglucose-6-phosphatase